MYSGVPVLDVHGHVRYMDERNIDVQVIGPDKTAIFNSNPARVVPARAKVSR